MTTQSPSYNRPRLILFFALAVFLIWLVLAKSLVAFVTGSSPKTVLALSPNNAGALMELAEKKMNQRLRDRNERADGGGTGSSTSLSKRNGLQIKAWAEKALVSEPLNSKALRILGHLADEKTADANKRKAENLMKMAVRLSKRESSAVYWLLNTTIKEKDYTKAVHFVDMLLRSRPQLDKYTIPVLVHIAQNKEGQGRMEQLLATNPPWRRRFFLGLRKTGVRDFRMPLRLLMSLKETSSPPTTNELRNFIGFLTSKQKYELAYYTWLQFLPTEQLKNAGLLFNGDFENKPSGLNFDWRLPRKSQALIEITSRPGQVGNKALSIEFGYGNANFGRVWQMTMMSSGSYRLKGSYLGAVKGRRGLRWRIVCVDGKKQVRIGEGPMFTGRESKWKSFEFTFEVPEQNCPAQYVRLFHDARTTSERLVSGHVWYDDLKISRVK